MSERTIDVSGENVKPEEAEPKKKNHASVKDRPANASRIYTRPDRAERAWEKDIRERCERTQDRLVEWLEGRGDYEMSEVLREDGTAMIGGMIAMCGSAAWLRQPVIGVMAVAEPIIAFGRLFKVLVGRWRDNRVEAAQERAQAEWEASQQAEETEPEQPDDIFRHNVVE